MVTASSQDTNQNHRPDLETCPHCLKCLNGLREWYRYGVILVLQPRIQKSDSVALLSECPKCFGLSWTHVRIDSIKWLFDDVPSDWVHAAEKLEASKKLKALRDWGAGLCHRCSKLDSGTVEYKAWRHCDIGIGPPETKCKSFERINKK